MNRPGGAIVTFWPDADFGARLAAIRREVARLFVVDNTADAAVGQRLAALCATHDAVLIAQPANVGLGAALNDAFARLAADGFTWALAFDQDSTPAPGFGASLLAFAQSKPALAVVGANWTDEARPDARARHLQPHPHAPILFRRPAAEHDLPAVTCVITSGSLFHLPTWRASGGFAAELFLDLVDTEYCLRAARHGRTVGVAAAARLEHRRGQKQPVRWLGRTCWPAFMPPLRLRYLFRNRVLVARRHGRVFPHWVAFELAYALKILAEIVFLEDRKRAKLAACLRGTWDGLLGRTGKIAEENTSASRPAP